MHDSNFLSEFYDFMSVVLNSHGFNFHIDDHTDPRNLDVACLNIFQHVQSANYINGNTLTLVITRGIDVEILSIAEVTVSDHSYVFSDITVSTSNLLNDLPLSTTGLAHDL